jgi:hypothetical protein
MSVYFLTHNLLYPILLKVRPLKNLAIFTILKKTMDFSEVTGAPRSRFQPVGLPGRRVKEHAPHRRELKKSPASLRKYGLCKSFNVAI